MSKIKILTYIIIGLTIINMILLGFIVFRPKGGGHDHCPKQHVLRHLKLDKKQLKAYDDLIEEHQIGFKAKNIQINVLKNQLYATLQSDASQEYKDSIIQELSAAYIEVEEVHYQHFEQLKAICNKEQIEGFDDMIKEIGGIFKNKDK